MLPSSTPLTSLASTIAVSSLRRRVIYCAPSLDLADPSDHSLVGSYGTSLHRVVVAVRRAAAATMTVRPFDASVAVTSARRIQWMVLDVPAARVPAGLVWSALGTSGQVEFSAPALAAPIVHTPSASLDSWLYVSTTPATIGTYSVPMCLAEGQPLAAGRALLLVVARLGTNDPIVNGCLRVEVSDE
jgi:hypothetical protein